MSIVPLCDTHWPEVAEIYLQGIETGHATFQKEAPAWEDWDKGHFTHSRLVALDGHEVIGWAALSPVSARPVYAGVAEVSIYIKNNSRGQGVGDALLKALIEVSEQQNIWTLQAGIFPENKASMRLHEKNNFRLIGFREKIGQMNGRWRDTVLLERRSKNIGIETAQ